MKRRELPGLAAGAMIAGVPLLGGCSADTSGARAPRPAAQGGGRWPGVRRYVVSSGRDGKSYTQESGDVPAGQLPGGGAGPGVLWVTNAMPVDNAAAVTASGAAGGFQAMPGPDGTVFSFIHSANGDILTPRLPSGAPAGVGLSGGRSKMHRTNSLDYWVILDGEIILATDTDEIHLKPGDTVVVRGANHAWVKASDKPYLAVTVSVDAKPLPG